MFKLFVGGFLLDMDEMTLAALITHHGDIATLRSSVIKKQGHARATRSSK